MPHPDPDESAPQPMGVVERLVRDDSRPQALPEGGRRRRRGELRRLRARRLRLSSSSRRRRARAPRVRRRRRSPPRARQRVEHDGRRGDPQLRAHARVPRDAVLRQGGRSRTCSAEPPARCEELRRAGAEPRRRDQGRRHPARRHAGRRARPASSRSRRPLPSRSSPTRSRTSAPSAYLGQAASIQSKAVLAAALAIHSVEARHAATLGTLVNRSVTPDGAFAKPADMATVLAAVKPFLA